MIRSGLSFLLTIFLLTGNILGQSIHEEEPSFSVEQLKNDLQYLRKNIEDKHPNLYLYTSKKELDIVFDSLLNGITKPLTTLEFYRHITVISSIIKDGHTIILPGSKTTTYYNKNSRFLPYHFVILNNRLFADMVCTGDNSIMEGAEILSINNVGSGEIIKQLCCRQVRDGNNQTYPTWILSSYFREYYSYIFGHPNQFIITYKQNDKTETATVDACFKDSINYYRQLKYPDKSNQRKPNEGLQFRVTPDNSFATLTIKDFHKEILKKEYHQDFEEEISRYFEELNKKGIANLILDLRDNQGGDISYGAFLLSYLLDKEFTIVQDYFKVDKSKTDFQLTKTNGEAAGIHKTKDAVFKGNLFVLINGGSFSNSGIVSSCLKRYNRAIFIGEETGGNNKVLAGYTDDRFLPNSGIQIQIPTRQFLLDGSSPLSGHGTIPDYPLQSEITSILSNKDKVMSFAIDLIEKKKGSAH